MGPCMGNLACALAAFKIEGLMPISSEPITIAVGPLKETS